MNVNSIVVPVIKQENLSYPTMLQIKHIRSMTKSIDGLTIEMRYNTVKILIIIDLFLHNLMNYFTKYLVHQLSLSPQKIVIITTM